MTLKEHAYEVHDVDRRLLEQLTASLGDPHLHRDVHARLRREISRLLEIAHDDLHGEAAAGSHERLPPAAGHELPEALEAVLVDPNLHTDMRAHIRQKLEELLTDSARDRA